MNYTITLILYAIIATGLFFILSLCYLIGLNHNLVRIQKDIAINIERLFKLVRYKRSQEVLKFLKEKADEQKEKQSMNSIDTTEN